MYCFVVLGTITINTSGALSRYFRLNSPFTPLHLSDTLLKSICLIHTKPKGFSFHSYSIRCAPRGRVGTYPCPSKIVSCWIADMDGADCLTIISSDRYSSWLSELCRFQPVARSHAQWVCRGKSECSVELVLQCNIDTRASIAISVRSFVFHWIMGIASHTPFRTGDCMGMHHGLRRRYIHSDSVQAHPTQKVIAIKSFKSTFNADARWWDCSHL